MKEKSRHQYPGELAQFLCDNWYENAGPGPGRVEEGESHAALLNPAITEELISTCYQASLLREEKRAIRFRIILIDPELLKREKGPPEGFQRIVFSQPRAFHEQELRRLSVAADFYRSLIGVWLNSQGELQIWGIVHSGWRWLQTVCGGGKKAQPLPGSLVIRVTNPGRLAVCRGSTTLATLRAGRIATPKTDVFDSRWFQTFFSSSAEEIWKLHLEARERAGKAKSVVQRDFLRIISQNVIKRIISVTRFSQHGGSFIIIPPELDVDFSSPSPTITLRYAFADDESRGRYRSLLLELCNELAASCGHDGDRERGAGWADYLAGDDRKLATLDEAVFEWAHFVSGLSAEDGAVVLNTRLDLLGFGALISGHLPRVETVARALDPQGERTVTETVGAYGMRHLSAFQFCNEVHDAIVIVVSQDGRICFVTWKDGIVTYWDQVAVSVLDV